jgi:hypothetical protein
MIFIKLVLRIYSNALTANGNPVRVTKLFLQLILLNLVFSANHLGADTDILEIDRNSDVEDIGGISLFNQPDKELTNNILPGNDMAKEAGLVIGNISNNNKADSLEKDNTVKGFVVGGNLKVGMSLNEAFKILGTPKSVNVVRGSNPSVDSISMEYLDQGVIIHVLTNKPKIEALELLQNFKGEFLEGIIIGSKIEDLIKAFGIPKSMESFIARYPQKGIYFSLDNKAVVSVQLFSRNSKILHSRLYQNE